MEWTEFLTYAAGPGVNAIVGVLLSEVVEVYLLGFAGLLPRWKRVAFFLRCMCVPLLASVRGVATAGNLLAGAGRGGSGVRKRYAGAY